jgi:hypothetical protein
MTARKLDKSQWRTLEGKQAEIEVASLSLGDQVEAERFPLHGMTTLSRSRSRGLIT